MYSIIKKVLFRFDAEKVHYWVMARLQQVTKLSVGRTFLKKRFCFSHRNLEKELFGLVFKNPVGLAAGFDKDARFTDALAHLGFGFIEIGTLTPKAQPGNEKPRLFRLPDDRALVNRMGFNNGGVAAAAIRLKKCRNTLIIGGNIGKNKLTPNEDAVQDYEIAFRKLYDVVDYFTINVSSPNTPGLRELQGKEPLQKLLKRLQEINQELGANKPILLKIAPDLSTEQLDEIIEIVLKTGIQGIVATNTTISREGLSSDPSIVQKIGAGGLSGAPIREQATAVIRYIHRKTNGKIPIIAAGGVFTAEDAREKLQAGASLVQVYSGFIYEGPATASNICKGLLSDSDSFVSD